MRYKDYIRSDAWRRRRLTKLESVNWQCEWCGDKGSLSVHHLNYKTLGHEASENLIVLCNSCHWVADEMRKGNHELKAKYLELIKKKPDHRFEPISPGKFPQRSGGKNWLQIKRLHKRR